MSDSKHKSIVGAARLNETAVLVEYSDKSSAIYTAAQLATLTPIELVTEDETEGNDDAHRRGNVVEISTNNVR